MKEKSERSSKTGDVALCWAPICIKRVSSYFVYSCVLANNLAGAVVGSSKLLFRGVTRAVGSWLSLYLSFHCRPNRLLPAATPSYSASPLLLFPILFTGKSQLIMQTDH